MSFAVTAASKHLQSVGLHHIVTAGGTILVSPDDIEALAKYEPNDPVPALVKVIKSKGKFKAIRNPDKLVPYRIYQRELMKARRAKGYDKLEKKLNEIRKDKPVDPERSKAQKRAWKQGELKIRKKTAEMNRKEEAKEKAARKKERLAKQKEKLKAAKKKGASKVKKALKSHMKSVEKSSKKKNAFY